jgi:glycerol-3-phosphate dehydrogenase subunit B
MNNAIVLGGGIAALAASYGLRQAGVVTACLLGGPGATALSSGALDGGQPGLAAQDVLSFCAELGLFAEPSSSVLVATRLGVLRYARARDGGILNVLPLAGRRVGIPRLPRLGWDADWLARSLNESPICAAQATVFVAFSVKVSFGEQASRLSAIDFSALVQQQREPLVGALRDASVVENLAGCLLPPACFLEAQQASEWSSELGIAVGETLSGVGETAGYRFERARNGLLERLGVKVHAGYASGVRATDEKVTVLTPDCEFSADVAVLATGGWVSGGVRLSDTNSVELSYELSATSGLSISLHGRPFSASAAWGADVGSLGLGELSQIGLLPLVGHRPTRIVAAGDASASGKRTLGAAIESGLAAAARLTAAFSETP